MKLNIIIVQPINHFENTFRAKEIQKAISSFGNVSLSYSFSTKKPNSYINNFIHQLHYFIKLCTGRYDVIHIMNIWPFVPQLIKFFSLKKSIIVYDISNYQLGIQKTLGRSTFILFLTRIIENAFIKNSDYLIANGVSFGFFIHDISSNKMAMFVPDPVQDLLANMEYLNEKGLTISNNSHTEGNSPEYDLRIAYVSTFFWIKINNRMLPRGWELLEALEKAKRRAKIKVQLMFIGKGDSIDGLKEMSNKLNLAENCFFSGFIPERDLSHFLSISDIGFMEDYRTLGYKYSVGAKVQTYMNSNLAVLTGNSLEKNYLLRDQKISWLLFEPCDVSSNTGIDKYIDFIANAIILSIKHKSDIKSAGIRNGRRSRIVFNIPTFQKLIIGAYSKICKESGINHFDNILRNLK